jgi:hypothetical protein
MKAREISVVVSVAFPMIGEEGPLTLDLRFSVEADLQHLEFSRQSAKPAEHVGSAFPTRRLCAFEDQ